MQRYNDEPTVKAVMEMANLLETGPLYEVAVSLNGRNATFFTDGNLGRYGKLSHSNRVNAVMAGIAAYLGQPQFQLSVVSNQKQFAMQVTGLGIEGNPSKPLKKYLQSYFCKSDCENAEFKVGLETTFHLSQ